MPSPSYSKAKGRSWENEVAEYLRLVFPDVERRRLAGALDRGDLINTGPWLIEAKNTKRFELSSAVDEAVVEARNAGLPYPVVVLKRPRRHVDESYAILPLWALRDVMEKM